MDMGVKEAQRKCRKRIARIDKEIEEIEEPPRVAESTAGDIRQDVSSNTSSSDREDDPLDLSGIDDENEQLLRGLYSSDDIDHPTAAATTPAQSLAALTQ
ncbi:hypothetical protein BGX31_003924 [Mortierella sp. GBA43]|nr:hypothetical protein BGX31_003924 [Mortierella sp. GBA43]